MNVFHLLTLWRNFVPITYIKTGRTKYTRISWLQPLPVPLWPFRAGPSISSSSSACSGTSSIFGKTVLCKHLEAHLDDNSKAHIKHRDAHKAKVFKMWVSVIFFINEAYTVETKYQQDLIEMLQHQAKCQNTDSLWGLSHHANASQANTLLLSLHSYQLPSSTWQCWAHLCNRLVSYPIIAARISKINNEPTRSWTWDLPVIS